MIAYMLSISFYNGIQLPIASHLLRILKDDHNHFFQAHSTDGDDHSDSSQNPAQIRNGSVRQKDGSGGPLSAESSGNVTRIASIDSFDSKWYFF